MKVQYESTVHSPIPYNRTHCTILKYMVHSTPGTPSTWYLVQYLVPPTCYSSWYSHSTPGTPSTWYSTWYSVPPTCYSYQVLRVQVLRTRYSTEHYPEYLVPGTYCTQSTGTVPGTRSTAQHRTLQYQVLLHNNTTPEYKY